MSLRPKDPPAAPAAPTTTPALRLDEVLRIGVRPTRDDYAAVLTKASESKEIKGWIDSVIKRSFPGYSWVLVSAGGKQKLDMYGGKKTKKTLLREVASLPGWSPEVHKGSDGFLYMMFPLQYTLDKSTTLRLVAHLMNIQVAYAYLGSGLNDKGEFVFVLANLPLERVYDLF
jgi:hypothetical protein